MLLEAAILRVCAGLSGVDHEGCSKALQASSVQTSVAQDSRIIESKLYEFAYGSIGHLTGDEVLGAAAVLVKLGRDHSIRLKILENERSRPGISTTAGLDGGRIDFGWRF